MNTSLPLTYQIVISTVMMYHKRLQVGVEQIQLGLSFLNQYYWEVTDSVIVKEVQKIEQELLHLHEIYHQNICICEKIYQIFETEDFLHAQQIAREIALIEQSFICAEYQYQRLTEYLNN